MVHRMDRLSPAILAVVLWVGLQQTCSTASSLHVQPVVTAAAAAVKPLETLAANQQQQPKHQQQFASVVNATVLLPGEPDPASDAMVAWLQQHGAEVNVAIRRNVPGVGRGTFAPKDFHRGDVLARIPVEMTYALLDNDDSLAVSGSYLVADMAEDDGPWAPYFRALPGPADVFSIGHIPDSYLPIVQDELTETAIKQMQNNVVELWKAHGAQYSKVLGPSMSAANITYAMGLLLSRLFRFDNTDVMLPIVDMANHDNACQHSHLPEPCDPEAGYKQWSKGGAASLSNTTGSGYYDAAQINTTTGAKPVISGQCFVWRAEESVAAGQEVCNSYKTLLQDRAVLQYGFLQRDSAAVDLHMLDRPDRIMDLAHVWSDPDGAGNVYGPRRFEGTPAQLWAEVDRLSERVEFLKGGDAAAAAVRVDEQRDPNGQHLAMMQEWRRQRKAAVSTEIRRLVKQAQRLEKAQKAWGLSTSADADRVAGGQTGLTTINNALLQWLEANGATVEVELQHLQPETLTPINSTPQQVCTISSSDNSQQSCSGDGAASASIIPNAGVFTRKQVAKGGLLAVIPVKLGYMTSAGQAKLDSAVDLAKDIHAAVQSVAADTPATTAASTLSTTPVGNTSAAFMLSLPPIGTVHSLYNFPQAYLPLLQSQRVARHIKLLQVALAKAFEARRPEIETFDNSTSFAEVQHAATVLFTRPLLPVGPAGREQQVLVPLFSNARHNSSCPHDYYIDTCPGSSSTDAARNLCFFWVAGAPLPADTEVCVSYGHLRPDQALLMYGLPVDSPSQLQEIKSATTAGNGDSGNSIADGEDSVELWLHGLDTAEATTDQPFGEVSMERLKHWIPEKRDEAVAESLWLIELHTNWTDPEATANFSTLQPVPWDASGALLDQLMLWRQRRIAALEYELGRLSEVFGISSGELMAAKDMPKLVNAGQGFDMGISSNFTSNSTDPWQRMLDWMRHNGAIINVNVTYAGPQYGRVVVTSEPMARGDLLASIPLELCWNTATSGGNGSMQLAAANFWAELDNATSMWRPYLDALPSQDEMMCPLVQMPPEYHPLLQDTNAETFLKGYQDNIITFWDEFGSDMATQLPSMTFDTFKYARGLLATRLFGLDQGASMVPLLDLANHAPLCPNSHTVHPCPNDPDRRCVVWFAGSFLAKGAEACNGYKWMANDRSVLQYGFIQSGFIKDRLHTMDHPGLSPGTIFSIFDKMRYGPPVFDGTPEEIQAEIARLQSRLANVTAGDSAAAATQAVPSDKGGRLLSLMLRWRVERKAVLQKEIERLQQRIVELEAHAAGKQLVAPEERLVEWLRESGGQVNGVRVGVQAPLSVSGAAAAVVATSGRGVYATEPIKQGSVLAAVPFDLALPVNTESMLVDGPMLFEEISQQHCPRSPYYATLPPREEVFSFYELPLEYAPVVQNTPVEDFINKSLEVMQHFEEINPDIFIGRNTTVEDMRHVFTLVATRLIHFQGGGYLVPFIDMANHKNGCKHNIGIKACDELTASGHAPSSTSSSSAPAGMNTTRVCVHWTAGADIKAGEEVCLPYGYVLPDRAMLQYGFIPPELLAAVTLQEQGEGQQQLVVSDGVSVPLFGMDRHDFKDLVNEELLPWQFWLDNATRPDPFTGSRRETAYEITRLELLADELAAGDAAAAAVQPVTSVDPDSSVLQRLRIWRELRKTAIDQEIKRLQKLQEL